MMSIASLCYKRKHTITGDWQNHESALTLNSGRVMLNWPSIAACEFRIENRGRRDAPPLDVLKAGKISAPRFSR